MKIGNATDVQKLEIPRHAEARPGNAVKPGVSSDEPVGKVEKSDKVELSQSSQLARHDTMPVRADKVAKVRAAIERGEFPVNPTKVADRMISQAVELVNLIVPAAPDMRDEQGATRDAAGAMGRNDGSDA